MKLGLRYETVYRPEQPVGFPPHEVRLFLRGDRLTRIRRTRNQRNGNAAPRYARALLANVIASRSSLSACDAVEMPFLTNPSCSRYFR